MLLKLRHCNCCSNLWSGTRQKCSCDVWLFVCHCIWSIWRNWLSNSYLGSVNTFSGLVCSNPNHVDCFSHMVPTQRWKWLFLVMWRNVLGSQTNMWDATGCGVGESPCFLLFYPRFEGSDWPVQLVDFGRVRDRRSDFHLFEWWLVESKVTAPCQNWIQEIQMTCAAFVIPWCSDDTAKIEVCSFRFRRFQTPNLSPVIFKNVANDIPQIPWLLDFKTPFRVARTSQNLGETKDSTAGTTWA